MRPLALIAGAGPGIGRALALRFIGEGFRVAVLARPGGAAEQLAGEIRDPASRVIGVDVSDRSALAEALLSVQESCGLPRCLVWNASHGHPGGLLAQTGLDLMADVEANLLAPLDAVRWALPGLRGGGRILITGGGLGLEPKPDLASSSLGKALQRHLSLLLDAELEAAGIRVATLTVCGFVQPESSFSPEYVARALWELQAQAPEAWERERVLRP
nr:SDR family NAD(P)-dependent oxidoreductase [uncultured Holophaga sp.]